MGLDEFFTAIRPAKKLIELAPITLDGLVDPLIDQLRNSGVVARVNLLMARRTWRWFGLCRYFCMKWHKGMDNQPDINLRFPISKGVSGQCFREKRPIYADPQALKSFPLSKKTGILTQHLQAVLSFPVFEQPTKKNAIQSGKLLGVLNLDSTTPDAYNSLTDAQVIDRINKIMQTTAAIAGRFFG